MEDQPSSSFVYQPGSSDLLLNNNRVTTETGCINEGTAINELGDGATMGNQYDQSNLEPGTNFFMQTMQEALTPKKAVSYLRVSTRGQSERGGGDDEGFSIPAQREGNKRKASALFAMIVKEFVDRGSSAKSADRDQLQQMLDYIRENQVDYVIVNKIDRLARNRQDDVEITRAIKDCGATLISATENIDGESPQNMLLHGIMASIAEFYSRNLATEALKGMSQKAKGGGTPYRAPVGYINIQAKDERGREMRYVAVDETRAPLIKLAFSMYATGDWSISDLATYLESRGLTSLPTPNKPSRPITASNLHDILTKPYYKGIVTFMGVQYAGKHEPLVDEATWQKVQDVMTSHKNGERSRVHNHFLKSTVYCGTCGARLIVHNAKSGSGKYYPYFVCVTKHRHGQRKGERCTQRAVLIYKVEEMIEQLYEKISLTPEVRQLLETWITEEIEQSSQSTKLEIADLEKQQQRLRDEEAKLLQAHYAEAISLELMQKEQLRISRSLTDITSRLSKLTADTDFLRSSLMQVLDLMQDCETTYKQAGEFEKRLLNQAFFDKIIVSSDGTIEPDYTEVTGLFTDPKFKSVYEGAKSACLGDDSSWSGALPTLTETALRTPDVPTKRKKSATNSGSGLYDWLSHTLTSSDFLFVESLRKKVLVGKAGIEPARLLVTAF